MDEIEEKVMVEIERTFVEDLLSKEKRLDAVIEVVEEWLNDAEIMPIIKNATMA